MGLERIKKTFCRLGGRIKKTFLRFEKTIQGLSMRNERTRSRTIRKRIGKCRGIFRAFNEIQLRYVEKLDLFAFIWNPPASRYDKVLAFIEMAISTRGRVKYRDVFRKRPDKS